MVLGVKVQMSQASVLCGAVQDIHRAVMRNFAHAEEPTTLPSGGTGILDDHGQTRTHACVVNRSLQRIRELMCGGNY